MRENLFNWYYFAHAIKDVFDPPDSVIVYGEDHSLLPILSSSEFGIECWGLFTNPEIESQDRIYNWFIGVDGTHFGLDFCKLFISVGYDPALLSVTSTHSALGVLDLMVDGGKVLAINSGEWSSELPKLFYRRIDLERELKRFSMLKDQDVKVYEK